MEVERRLNRVKPQNQEHCFGGDPIQVVFLFVVILMTPLFNKLLVKVIECKKILNDIEHLLVGFFHRFDTCFASSFSLLFNQQGVENGKTLNNLSSSWQLFIVASGKPFTGKFLCLFGKEWSGWNGVVSGDIKCFSLGDSAPSSVVVLA